MGLGENWNSTCSRCLRPPRRKICPGKLPIQLSRTRAGAVYVFYGRDSDPYPDTTDEADLTLEGLDARDLLGHEAFGMPPLTTADMNGDGLADILVSAPTADGPGNRRQDAGEAYVIFTERR